MAAEKVSGAAVFVMMAESFVPRGADLFVADLAKKEEKSIFGRNYRSVLQA